MESMIGNTNSSSSLLFIEEAEAAHTARVMSMSPPVISSFSYGHPSSKSHQEIRCAVTEMLER